MQKHLLSLVSKFRPTVSISSNRSYGNVGVLGVPFGQGSRQQHRKGVALAPDVIRGAGFVKELRDLGVEVKDFGDVTYKLPATPAAHPATMETLAHNAACNQQTSLHVASVLQAGYKCLCLGGDHAIAVGSIDGHLQHATDVAVLWIDAHADINTANTTITGNIHGMPLALLAKELKEYWPVLPGMEWLVPKLSLKNLAYIGLRDVDPYERLIIEKFNIAAYGMDDVERFGIHAVTNMALQRIDPNNNRSIHVSFDIDGLDPQEAPSTAVPVRGGLTMREGVQLIEDIQRTQRLTCLDIVEVNPTLGDAKDLKYTLNAVNNLIRAAFGHSRRGHVMPGVSEIPTPVASK